MYSKTTRNKDHMKNLFNDSIFFSKQKKKRNNMISLFRDGGRDSDKELFSSTFYLFNFVVFLPEKFKLYFSNKKTLISFYLSLKA